METVGGEGSETGSVNGGKGKSRRPVSVPASSRTSWIKRTATTISSRSSKPDTDDTLPICNQQNSAKIHGNGAQVAATRFVGFE